MCGGGSDAKVVVAAFELAGTNHTRDVPTAWRAPTIHRRVHALSEIGTVCSGVHAHWPHAAAVAHPTFCYGVCPGRAPGCWWCELTLRPGVMERAARPPLNNRARVVSYASAAQQACRRRCRAHNVGTPAGIGSSPGRVHAQRIPHWVCSARGHWVLPPPPPPCGTGTHTCTHTPIHAWFV